MQISFGKFIPVKVFVDNKEVVPDSSQNREKINAVSGILCNCLSRHGDYPNTFLAEQQRRYFASEVSDFKLPQQTSKNKTDISDSLVKTANIRKSRYLITGSEDINSYNFFGYQLGSKKKENRLIAEKLLDRSCERISDDLTLNLRINQMTYSDNKKAANERIKKLIDYIKPRTHSKTLYINAITNPNAKLKRDKYIITLIDFKA